MYDFDASVDRRSSDSIKWAVGKNELPMWIADMDFQAAPEIVQALEERLSHGVFGYGDVKDDWYDAYIQWWKTRHGLTLERDWMIFSSGVVPTISSTVRKLTTPNENVVLLTPVYNIFYNSVVNNGARVLESPLVYNGEDYEIDFADLEKKLSDPQTSLLIFCNPHNPIGKIWDKQTLARIGDLCAKHRVPVLSDEIHCDIVRPGRGYVPFISASETCRNNCVMCVSPTKAFNIAGMQTSAAVVPDLHLRNKVRRALNTDEVAEPNSFAVCAAVAAFQKGGRWLDELCAYLFRNRDDAERFIQTQIPQIAFVKANATYLLWIDVSSLHVGSVDFCAFLRKKTGLILSCGESYGKGGEGFLRMNLACPNERLKDGLERLKNGVEAYLSGH